MDHNATQATAVNQPEISRRLADNPNQLLTAEGHMLDFPEI